MSLSTSLGRIFRVVGMERPFLFIGHYLRTHARLADEIVFLHGYGYPQPGLPAACSADPEVIQSVSGRVGVNNEQLLSATTERIVWS